jgi:hypothetical protein
VKLKLREIEVLPGGTKVKYEGTVYEFGYVGGHHPQLGQVVVLYEEGRYGTLDTVFAPIRGFELVDAADCPVVPLDPNRKYIDPDDDAEAWEAWLQHRWRFPRYAEETFDGMQKDFWAGWIACTKKAS